MSNVVDINSRRDGYAPPHRRLELSTSGIDEFKQLIGGDGEGRITSTGLRVPPAPWSPPPVGLVHLPQVDRYTMQLVTLRVDTGRRIIIRGLRQLATIGINAATPDATPYIVEMPVTTPNWGFQDGNIAWGLRRVNRPRERARVTDTDSFRYRFSDTSATGALVYESATFPPTHLSPAGRPDFYTSLTSYVAPNRGRFYGQALDGQFSTFRDLRFDWKSDEAWDSLHIPVEGPCSVVFYASVRQTNPATRGSLAALLPFAMPDGMPPEEQFLLNFPTNGDTGVGVQYWRVAGGIVYENVDGGRS